MIGPTSKLIFSQLKEKIKLGDHFFRSDNDVHVEFPKPELFTDEMSSLVQTLGDRMTAVTVSPQFLTTVKHLRFTKLQSIHITAGHGIGNGGSFEDILSLISLNAPSLKSLKFYYLEVPENVEMSHQLPLLQDLYIRDVRGDKNCKFLLSVIKRASHSNNSEDETKISSLKKLYMGNRYFTASAMSSLLTSVPNLEQLTLERCDISSKLDLTCQLPKLKKLDVTQTRGIIPAIIRGAVELEVSKIRY